MDHGLDIENRVRDGLLRLAKDLGIPPIATNDSHYVNREDARVPGAPALRLLRQHDGHPGRRPRKRFAFDGDGYYIKSAAEMRALWGDSTASPRRATTRC